jgi:hypothetical protein
MANAERGMTERTARISLMAWIKKRESNFPSATFGNTELSRARDLLSELFRALSFGSGELSQRGGLFHISLGQQSLALLRVNCLVPFA